MYLGPDALQKDPQAPHTHDVSIEHRIGYRTRRGRGGAHIGLHQQKRRRCKHCPADDCQHHSRPGRAVGRPLLSKGIHPGHIGVHAHAGPHRNGSNDQLDRKDHRQGCQAAVGVLPHKVAVHNIIEGLDQLGQHHRRGDAQQDLPHTLRLKIAVIHSCLTHIRSPFLSHSKFRLPPGYEPQEPTHYDTISGKNFKGQNR